MKTKPVTGFQSKDSSVPAVKPRFRSIRKRLAWGRVEYVATGDGLAPDGWDVTTILTATKTLKVKFANGTERLLPVLSEPHAEMVEGNPDPMTSKVVFVRVPIHGTDAFIPIEKLKVLV